MSGGREFQRIDAVTGNERRPAVARRYVGTWSWSKVKVKVRVKRSSGRRELCTSIECSSSYHRPNMIQLSVT